MNTSALLLGILPLLAFVIVDSFMGIKAALISTVVLSIAEAIFSWMYFGELDSVTIFTLVTVLIMAAISYQKRRPIFIKFQPVILSAVLGMALIISWLVDEPFMLKFAMKYKMMIPKQFAEGLTRQDPIIIRLFTLSTLNYGLGILLHGATTAWAALKLSNWWWIIIRGVGFYVFALAATVITRILL